jgi:hypothetical protein
MSEDVDTKYGNLKPILGQSHIEDTAKIAKALMTLHWWKEQQYDRSFAKRGETGVFHNLARKFDRIEHDMSRDVIDASTVDAIADLAVYAVKWMDILCKVHQSAVIEWLENVYCPATGALLSTAKIEFGINEDEFESIPG